METKRGKQRNLLTAVVYFEDITFLQMFSSTSMKRETEKNRKSKKRVCRKQVIGWGSGKLDSMWGIFWVAYSKSYLFLK